MPPAARQDDTVTGVDTHVVLVPAAAGAPVPTPGPHPFSGRLIEGLAEDVLIGGRPAAVRGSVARNVPAHVPIPPSGTFQRPPPNRGTVQQGSSTVLIGGEMAARQGDAVVTCNDPVDAPTCSIASGLPTVLIG